MDNDLFLTGETLRLTPSLARGQPVNETFALKCVHTQGYVIVDGPQAAVLNEFSSPRTVPEVLEVCINNRICLPLREYYELVLKAYRAGILCSEQAVPLRRPAVRWFLGVRPAFLGPLVCLLALGSLFTLVTKTPVAPADPLEWLWGWLAICGALSLGEVLAATALRGAGAEVYQPRVRWQTGVPHFAVDLRDVCMIGRGGRAVVLATPLVVLGSVAAAALWLQAGWGVPVLAAFFALARPVGGGPVRALFDLLRRKPLRDTSVQPLFTTGRNLRVRCRAAWQWFDLRSALVHFLYAIAWTVGLVYFTYRYIDLDPRLAFQDRQAWEEAGLAVVAVILGTALAVLLGAILGFAGRAFRRGWTRWKRGWRRWRSAGDLGDHAPSADSLLRRNVLLRTFPAATLTEIAQHTRPFKVGAWSTIIQFDSEPAEVGVIVSGRMTVYRRLPSGSKVRFLELVEGDIFGAHALVDAENRSLEVRTNTPCTALVMSSEHFKRQVVDRAGAAVVCSYVHKLLFLQQTALCARWRPAAIVRFIELARNIAYPAGTKILQEGAEVCWLCVIYEGRARALRGCKQIGKLRPGDVFGEMSLLQASGATADVETIDDTRCFVVDRVEFIRFMSRNHHVALQVERIASKRLGRPIFPLTGRSFDVR